MRKVKKLVVQWHHISYTDGSEPVPMYKGEHWMITRLDRKFRLSKTKPFSIGFLQALASFYNLYGNKAVDLKQLNSR